MEVMREIYILRRKRIKALSLQMKNVEQGGREEQATKSPKKSFNSQRWINQTIRKTSLNQQERTTPANSTTSHIPHHISINRRRKPNLLIQYTSPHPLNPQTSTPTTQTSCKTFIPNTSPTSPTTPTNSPGWRPSTQATNPRLTTPLKQP